MRRLFLIVLFVLVFIVSAAAYTPLGFILNRMHLSSMNIGWAKVDGTLRDGRISGLYVQNQPLGDVTLKLRMSSLWTLAPVYDVQWGGAGGRGSAVITLRQNAIEGEAVRAQQFISAIEGVAPPIRMTGGSVNVRDTQFRLTHSGCEQISGEVSTDVITRAGADYGIEIEALRGPVSCRDGQIMVSLTAESDAGDEIVIDAQSSLFGDGEVEMRVQTLDNRIALALSQFGFSAEDGEWVYRQKL